MTRGTLLTLGLGTALVLGLAAAAIWRGPEPSSAPARAATPPPAQVLPATPVATPPPSAPSQTAAPQLTARVAHDASADPADEPALMAELRSIKSSDPARAMHLAASGNERFPDSADAPERATILIHLLAQEGHVSEARRNAEQMVNHYPDSSWVRDVELFTGAHRHRSIRINDQGGVETY